MERIRPEQLLSRPVTPDTVLSLIHILGDKHTLFTNPVHPYTKVLFAAVPTVGEKPLVQGIDAKGEIPSPVNLPKGCYFSDRCPYATDRCRQEKPMLREVEPGHMAACHLL